MCFRVAHVILGLVIGRGRAGSTAINSAIDPARFHAWVDSPFWDDPVATDDQIPFRPVLSAFLGIVVPLLCIAVGASTATLSPDLCSPNNLPYQELCREDIESRLLLLAD